MQENHHSRRTSRRVLLCACLVAASLSARSSPADSSGPIEITLEQALTQAFRESPVLDARGAAVRRAEARLLAARTYPYNPEIELAAADRQGLTDTSTDRGLSISQEIEVGGQRGKRAAVATAEIEAVQSSFEREQRLLAARVRLAFAEALRAIELVQIAAGDAELTRQLLDFASRRLEAGAGTQIELNLAQSTAGQAERTLRLAEAADASARSRLAEAIGASAGEMPVPVGQLDFPTGEVAERETLLEKALENRADLEALRKETESSRRAIQLSRSQKIPNLRLGAFYEEEEGTDEIKGVALAIPIPLFNRNQGEIAEARAEVDRLSAEGSAAELTIQREVMEALATYRAAQQAAISLRDLVVGTLEENLSLLRRALDAGKIGASDVLVFRREFVEGQRQFVEALFEAQAARIALDLATGSTTLPTTAKQEALHDS
ncbi:MAG: TolC family protein [Myxococcales bacterium]|nr:TolC family protein [Deltaproteobacteria bacterium]NNL24925.1 TolC family protein [Myxococcales bacterium]